MPLNLKSYHEHTITIDDHTIRLRLKRLTVQEFEVFNAYFTAMANGRQAPVAAEDAPAAAQAWRARIDDEAEYLRANAAWLAEAFERYVTVEAGDLVVDDEVITSGGRLAEVLGGFQSVLSDLLGEIWLTNRLTDAQKKTLRSLPDLGTGSSTAPPSAERGSAPATAATSADLSSSVERGAVTAAPSDPSSGTTDPLSCAPAPSGS